MEGLGRGWHTGRDLFEIALLHGGFPYQGQLSHFPLTAKHTLGHTHHLTACLESFISKLRVEFQVNLLSKVHKMKL